MAKYNIRFIFDDNHSLNDILIKVLLREIRNLEKNKNNSSLSFYSNKEGNH